MDKGHPSGLANVHHAPATTGEDDISLVAVKIIDCEKTYEEAESRRVQYKANAKV